MEVEWRDCKESQRGRLGDPEHKAGLGTCTQWFRQHHRIMVIYIPTFTNEEVVEACEGGLTFC